MRRYHRSEWLIKYRSVCRIWSNFIDCTINIASRFLRRLIKRERFDKSETTIRQPSIVSLVTIQEEFNARLILLKNA